MKARLDVRGLTVELPTAGGWVRPVNDVSFTLGEGEALGIVGESGCGKTMLALALMGLEPPGTRRSGEAWLSCLHRNGHAASAALASSRDKNHRVAESRQGTASAVPSGVERKGALAPEVSGDGKGLNLIAASPAEMRVLRGREIAMIFQEPMTALNPVMRAGDQIAEAICAHQSGLGHEELHRRVLESLAHAAVPEPELRARQYPHQLSGGLRQRVMIAMALAAGPGVLIADEPTTALDVTVQQQILQLLASLRRELRLSLLFITHDLGVVAQVADRVAVMYAGRLVEEGPAPEVLRRPRHPYTEGLLRAAPGLDRRKLESIPGAVPSLDALPRGCSFAPRCPRRIAECDAAAPELLPLAGAPGNRRVRCILAGEKV